MNIIIIGAGPAGLLCGIRLVEKGIDCRIIEKKEEIGKPLKCAEGISEDGLKLVDDSEIIEKVKKREIKGSVVIVPSGKSIYFRKKGFLIDREKLEKLLAQKFLTMGGKIIKDRIIRIQNCELQGINKNYQADLKVIATGCESIKGIKYPYKGFLFATEKRFKDSSKKEFLEFYHGERFRPIYMWKFYHGEFAGIGKSYRDKKHFESLKEFLQVKESIKTITGKIPFPLKPPDFLYHDKNLFIGDAGGFAHQLTFAGIHGTFLSAILCAETIEKFAKKSRKYELEKYNLLLKRLPYFKKSLYKARNILYSSSDNELEVVGNLMNKREYRDIPYGRAIINLLKNPFFLVPYIKFLWIQKTYKMSEKISF